MEAEEFFYAIVAGIIGGMIAGAFIYLLQIFKGTPIWLSLGFPLCFLLITTILIFGLIKIIFRKV